MPTPSGGTPRTVISVNPIGDHQAQWHFSAPVVSVDVLSAFNLPGDAANAISASVVGGDAVINYDGGTLGSGDPWSIAAGAWATFTGGGTVAAGSGTLL